MATRALIIDDDPYVHGQLAAALVPSIVDEVETALHPGHGIRSAFADPPSVILLDINMPDMDGFKVCCLLKDNPATRDVPVLFLTVDKNMVHLARAFDCGATDYIRKPVNEIELQSRLRSALRDRQMMELLREQARVDALTGLLNRAGLDESLAASTSLYDRTGTPLSLFLLDVDHFKRINDERGHGAGDEALRAIGSVMRSTCRPYDTPCRYGGDEFAVIFGQVDGQRAERAAGRLFEALSRIEIETSTGPLEFTMSAGLVCTTDLHQAFEPVHILEAADAALYQAKSAGRDRVVTRHDF
ncbi:MAG: diguanylate cyclase [Myxococcota bacterium]|nr:diguanylate cyclase [Myxococcota bacterium]